MKTITVQITDNNFQQLQSKAAILGISLEELVLMGVNKLLITESETDFEAAMDYVLDKNAELYKRLA